MEQFIFLIIMPTNLLAIYQLNRCMLGKPCVSGKRQLSTYLVYGMVGSMVHWNNDIPGILRLFNLLGFFALGFNYNATIKHRLINSVVVYGVFELAETLMVTIVQVMDITVFREQEYMVIVGALMVRLSIIIFTTLFYKYKYFAEAHRYVPMYYYVGHTIIALGTIYLFIMTLGNAQLTMTKVGIASGTVILINITVLYVDKRSYETMLFTHEKQRLIEQNKAYEEHTQVMEQSLHTIRQVRHDMHNHLIALKQIHLAEVEADFNAYIDTLLTEIGGNRHTIHTGNFMFDSIINFKLQQVIATGAAVALDISIPETWAIASYDLTVILGNLLDNAVTAITHTEGESKLNITAKVTKGTFILVIENTYNGCLIIEDGIIQTTKKDTAHHGIGLSNVRKVVERYDGDLHITPERGWFSIAILLPNILSSEQPSKK